MTKIDLPYVQRFKDRHGKVRHYFRKPGCKRVAIPGVPGSAEFMEAYAAAELGARTAGETRSAPGSVSALIAAYYQSDAFAVLKPQTQANYRNILDRFRGEYGNLPAKRMEDRHLKAILDKKAATPGAARVLLKRLRGVFAFGVERGLVPSNPATGVRLARRKTDGFRAWTDADIERFLADWPRGSRARLALHLLLYTGQRRSDVVTMGWQHVRGGSIHVTQKKTGTQLVIPLHAALKAELDRLPKTNLTFLMTAYGKPMTEAGFTQWFVECAKAAGLPERSGPHGLRKAAARILAEAGCSALEIAAITGHESLKEVERYTKSAQQAKLAKAAMARITSASH